MYQELRDNAYSKLDNDWGYWEAKCIEDANAHISAEEWYRTVWLNMSEKERLEYV